MLITDKTELEKYQDCHRVWQGVPGIEHTVGGHTYIAFYSGATSETFGNYVLLYRSQNETDYELIAAVQKIGKYRCFDPVLWIDPLGRLWLFWNVMPGEDVYGILCNRPDEERLYWSEERYIGRGVMMNKPTVLSNGDWLLPIAMWSSEIHGNLRASGLKKDDEPRSYVYRSSDNGESFIRLGGSAVKDRRCDEHIIVELNHDVLAMYVRTKYGIGISHSYNGGSTWSVGGDSGLGGPCSRFFIGRLSSGRLLLVNHVNFTGRNNLTALLSEDNGKTFPYSLLLDERNGVSYPDVTEKDGYLYIVYDRDRGCNKKTLEEAYRSAREILVAKLTEEDIMASCVKSQGGYLKRVVSKLGKLSGSDMDPYETNALSATELAERLVSQGGDIVEKTFALFPFNCSCIYDIDVKKVENLIRRLEESGGKDVELLSQIITIFRNAPEQEVSAPPIIDAVKTYIEANIAKEFRVNELAEQLHISVYYLCHMFKANIGITVTEYSNLLRIAKAKQLLTDTNGSINSIAQSCGFCTAAYFAEIFSRIEKTTPSEYRKIHKKGCQI